MRKFISLIVAVVLLITALVSCNNTQSPEQSKQQSTQSTTAENKTQKAKITKLTINGKEQDLETIFIEYTLSEDEVKIPVVAAEKSEGDGELIIEQATTIPGNATVTLNEVKYTIMFNSNIEYEKSALQNTYHKLVSGERFNVAYIGGSVTAGAAADPNTEAYRALTTKWFKDNFDARVIETNAGIGNTGSFYGAYRAIDHLKLRDAEARPDLVFIEFAVNDYYYGNTADEIKMYGESIIRNIYQANPNADIIILIVTEKANGFLSSTSPNTWREIAEHYGIPVVELGQKILSDISKNGKTWNDYFPDVVHPNKDGHALYAKYIAELLKAELVDKKVSPFVYSEKVLPEQGLSGKSLNDLSYHETHNLSIPGFTRNSAASGIGMGLQTTSTTTFKFTFSGTGAVLSLGNRDDIDVAYTIDGVTYADYNVSDSPHKLLAEGLDNGTHTVSVTIKRLGTGAVFDLCKILVQGNTAREGIKILYN